MSDEPLRRLPSVHRLLALPPLQDALGRLPAGLVREAVREELAELRRQVRAGASAAVDAEALAEAASRRAARWAGGRLRRVINATGVVLHTNLGRAVLAEAARQQVDRVMAGYSNLEYDLEAGRRGSRHAYVADLLRRLTGAEEALVVNNNAAAVLLALRALAAGREVIVSRGQLVEIGGAFRVPDVMRESGAVLVEVGTTNKTHLYDYEQAVGERTALLLRVHQSNFRQVGFTEEVPREALVALGRRVGLPVMEDLGSGVLVDLRQLGVGEEPTVQEAVRAGVDLVTFSGDKLLGGPQAGIVVGRRDLVRRIGAHPLTRALRPDKLTLAALEATLALYLDPEAALTRVPTLAMLLTPYEALRRRARRVAAGLRRQLGAQAPVAVVEDASAVGGGALPGVELRTAAVAIRVPHLGDLEAALRRTEPPVVARLGQEALLLDMRTVREEEVPALVAAVAQVLRAQPRNGPEGR